MGLFSKISNGLKKTRSSISNAVEGLLNRFTKIDEELFEELEEILVMSDVGINTAVSICDSIKQKIKQEGITDPVIIKSILSDTVSEMLKGETELNLISKPSVILVIGVNGAGKTTTIGKLSSLLKNSGKKVIIGAADTFRAAAIDQLEIWANRVGVDIIKSNEGADPSSVVYDTIAAAKARKSDVIICDTAGRLHNKKNLMDELAKMYRIIKRELPESEVETLLVIDATTGQNGVNQAREFKTVAEITGIVLTKLDGTAKGGVVLAIKQELQIPVKYIGVGEQLDDLQPFDSKVFSKALFDGGE